MVITGSSRGLGYALADQFLGFGDDVIISSRNMSACEHAAVQLGEKHPLRKVLPYACDVRNAGKALSAASHNHGTGIRETQSRHASMKLPVFTRKCWSPLTWAHHSVGLILQCTAGMAVQRRDQSWRLHAVSTPALACRTHADTVYPWHTEEVESLARFAQEKLGRVDIWVNNAGITQAHKATLQHTDAEELRRIIDTNLLGSIFGARAALQASSARIRSLPNPTSYT